MEEYLVQMKGISKFFPGVVALDKVDFELRAGEVHALLGENGAGKSTLMKIIGGIYQKDEGEVKIRGKTQEYSTVAQASELGIAVIHQELNMCRHLTVAENIFLGRELKKGGMVDFKEQNARASKLLKELSLNIEPDTEVGKLSVSKQQMVEIAKALSTNADIIIMDEPSSALTERETQELFRIINELKNMGKGIIYISHRLEELENIVDRVTVMRDGKYIKTADFKDLSIGEIIALMVGREITEKYPHEQTERGKKIMEVKGISTSEVQNISFDLYSGEILGFAGLVGAGRTELVRALFGADKITAGEVVVYDKSVKLKSPRDAVKAGIVCAPEDRKKDGLLVELDVSENIAIANLDTLSNPVGVLSAKRERDMANRAVKELKIKTPSIKSEVKNLSGGNQQKIVVGKWLMRDAKVIIFDEPTRGIDVAAKVEIYNLMNKLKRSGIGVMFVSSELPEVLGMSDRIIVMCSGRITGELSRDEATQEKIMELATKFRTELNVQKNTFRKGNGTGALGLCGADSYDNRLCADKSAVLLRNQYNEPSAPGGADIDNRRRSVVRPHNCRNRPLNRLGRGNVVHDKRDADDKIQYEPDFNRAHNYCLLSCNRSCKRTSYLCCKAPGVHSHPRYYDNRPRCRADCQRQHEHQRHIFRRLQEFLLLRPLPRDIYPDLDSDSALRFLRVHSFKDGTRQACLCPRLEL